jgi:hypothetical protein
MHELAEFAITAHGGLVRWKTLMTNLVGAHRVHWNAFVKKMGDDQLIDAIGKVRRTKRKSSARQFKCW